MATRRRAAPYILRLGGLTHGSGQFFGQLVHNRTTELREMQDIENLKKFADGDPETFLEYWKTRQKSVKGKLKDEMAAYALRAEKRVKRNAEDAKALAQYARTNNHQAYMDHLLKRLDDEVDPVLIGRLGTQINELRSRIFSSSSASGVMGGGISQDAFTTARDKWGETRMKYESIVKGRPLTAMEFEELTTGAKEYTMVLKTIIFSNDATQSRKDTMNNQYLLKDGPNPEFLEKVEAASDQRLLIKMKDDSSFAALIAPLIQAKKFGEVARMYAERQRDLSVLAPQALGVPGADAIGRWLDDSDKQAVRWATEATKEAAKFSPANEEKLDAAYSSYWSEKTADHEDDASMPGPKEKGIWKQQLKNAPNAAQFSTDVGYPYSNSTFDELQKLVKGGVTYDPINGYEGDPDAVASLEEADRAIKIAINTPGSDMSIYKQAGLDDALSVKSIRDGTLTPQIAQMIIQAGIPPRGGYPGETGQTEVASAAGQPSDEMAPPEVGVPAIDPFEVDQQAPPSAGAAGGGKPGMQMLAQPTDITPDDYGAATQGVDTYLTAYSYGDLPDWTPPKETPVADFDSLFPFEGTPPQVTQPPTGGGIEAVHGPGGARDPDRARAGRPY